MGNKLLDELLTLGSILAMEMPIELINNFSEFLHKNKELLDLKDKEIKDLKEELCHLKQQSKDII